MSLFPYGFRPGQAELVRFIDSAVRGGRSAVIEAGTGTGKTVSSLCGALPYALEKGTKVIYLTRTKSQQLQISREVSAIGGDVLCVALRGRSGRSCPMMRGDPELEGGTPEELSRLCSEYKRPDRGGERRCPYYARALEESPGRWAAILRESSPDPEEFSAMCESAGICPYEFRKLLLPMADVIAAPYPFVFVPGALAGLETWMGIPLNETVIIADEAHNLPGYLRDLQTISLSASALGKAEKEAEANGDPYLYGDIRAKSLISAVGEAISHARTEYMVDEDGIVPPYFLEEELMEALGVPSAALFKAISAMYAIGDGIAERRKQAKKLPRSYLRSLAAFLQAWSEEDGGMRVKLIADPGNPTLQSYCMDPSPAAWPLNECRSSIHMSGTLEPLDGYAEEMGLFAPAKLSLGSPFPPENLLTLYSDEVSMGYDDRFRESNYRRAMDLIADTIAAAAVNSAVFFQSYGVMDRMLGDGLAGRIGREAFFERRGASQEELMTEVEAFRASDCGVLFCVLGGRISEGIDFPGRAMELAVIVGVPYPRPTAKLRALRRYYDLRFGDGQAFASAVPASRKMRQAVGRLIRSETDRGAAVILDRRVASLKGIGARLSRDIPGEVAVFFGEKRGAIR